MIPTTKKHPTGADNSDALKLQTEIVRLLYKSTTQAALLALFVTSFLYSIFRQSVVTHQLNTWLILMAIVYSVRLLFNHKYKCDLNRDGNQDDWLQRFRLGALLSGIAWGLSSLFLLKPEPYLQAAYLLSITGIISAGYNSYVIDKVTSYCYSLPILILGIVPSFFIPSQFGLMLSLECLLIVLIVGVSAHMSGKRMRENLRLRIISNRANQEMNNLVQRQRLHVENTPLAVIERDTENKITYWNSAATRMFGYQENEAIGTEINFLLPTYIKQMGSADSHLFSSTAISQLPAENQRKDGSIIYCEWYNTVLTNAEGDVIGVASLVSDETQIVQAQEKAQRLAYYDALTQLPNRRFLTDRIANAITKSEISQQHFAVIYLDLDNFKMLNDTKGHACGDVLLQELAKRLQKHLRKQDLVARLGGDEFIVLLENLSTNYERAEEMAISVTHNVQHAINQPFLVDDADYNCSASIGVAISVGNTHSLDDLLRNADIAMYEAKNLGKNNYLVFKTSLLEKQDRLTRLKNDLAMALNRQQLYLCFQMQVDKYDHMTGAEVLLRWQHHEYGLISPAEFIPLAEETGLIHQIGQWVLKQACILLNRWQNIPNLEHLKLSVNVSAVQFASPSFVDSVAQTLHETSCPADSLVLELTESAVLDDLQQVVRKMHALNRLGIALSLDDFGVGQSSLSTLKHLPLQELKLDQSFVHDKLIGNGPNQFIVQSVISLGEMLKLNIVAEGIETLEQANALRAAGCRTLQGYYFGKPVEIIEFERLFAERPAQAKQQMLVM